MFTEKSTWKGPHSLHPYLIDKLVRNDGPGMYALGSLSKSGSFEMKFIGSCANLKARLKSYLGKYDMFMFDLFDPDAEVLKNEHVLAEYKLKVNKISDRD